MPFQITVLPQQQNITAVAGENLLDVLRSAGLAPDTPCGGAGTCGKCSVRIYGREALACRTTVESSMTVTLSAQTHHRVLTDGILPQAAFAAIRSGALLAFDIGTTTVVGYLLDGIIFLNIIGFFLYVQRNNNKSSCHPEQAKRVEGSWHRFYCIFKPNA